MTVLLTLLLACDADPDENDPSDTGGVELDAPPILLNEFLASNDTVNADEAGEYDDWVELYNAGSTLVQLDGFHLTDDEEQPTRWAFPAGQGIDPGGYLLVWCDGDDDQGDLHTSFKLSAAGERLELWYVEGNAKKRVDVVTWEAQSPDRSASRYPDGEQWEAGTTPTPEAANVGG